LAPQKFDEMRLVDPKSREFVAAQLVAFADLVQSAKA